MSAPVKAASEASGIGVSPQSDGTWDKVETKLFLSFYDFINI
jgi:hypothetical protein